MLSSSRTAAVVVGYDGSECADAALTYAAARVGRYGRIIAVHAVPDQPAWRGTSVAEGLRARAADTGELVLDKARRQLAPRKTEAWLLEGDAPMAMLETAKLLGVDEVVVGARGQSGLRTALGSTALATLSHADVPLTVVPRAAERIEPVNLLQRAVVIAASGAQDERTLREVAARVARASGARLTVLGVVDAPASRRGGGGVARLAAPHAAAERLAARLRRDGLDVDLALRCGDTASQATDYAATVGAGLIITGVDRHGAEPWPRAVGATGALFELRRSAMLVVPSHSRAAA